MLQRAAPGQWCETAAASWMKKEFPGSWNSIGDNFECLICICKWWRLEILQARGVMAKALGLWRSHTGIRMLIQH